MQFTTLCSKNNRLNLVKGKARLQLKVTGAYIKKVGVIVTSLIIQ